MEQVQHGYSRELAGQNSSPPVRDNENYDAVYQLSAARSNKKGHLVHHWTLDKESYEKYKQILQPKATLLLQIIQERNADRKLMIM